jgi:hypothetical protein
LFVTTLEFGEGVTRGLHFGPGARQLAGAAF